MTPSTSTKSRPHSRTLLHVSSLVIAFLFALCSPSVASRAVAQTVPAAKIEERERGIELFRQRNFSEAARQLRKAVGKNKLDAEAWHYLGMALLRQEKQAKNAAKAFESALKLRPDFAPALVGLSYSFLLRNKLPEAIREARAALTIDPETRDAHYILGVAHLRLGSRDDALQDAEKVVKLDPQFAGGYLLKSQALVPFVGDVMVQSKVESSDSRKARYRDAAEALEKYLQLDPNTKEKQTWIEQLESLRFYSMSPREGDTNRVYSGKEVMTKARVLSKPEPAYTEPARQNLITGTVVLRAIFAADGKVKHILVLSGLPHGLTERSVRAARLIKFIPASIDGRPVSMFIQLEYNFNLY